MKTRKEIIEDKKEPERMRDNEFSASAKAQWIILAGLGIFALIVWLIRLFT
jgi:hypothetical protein